MPLEKYTQRRLVVLTPNASAYDAARAMEANHIGCVVVHDGAAPIGIVTDRDLALQLVACGVDPSAVKLGSFMSTPLATLPVTASTAEAAQLMLERHVRRVAIVDGHALAGIVTLDDLILDECVDPGALAEIVRAQLSEPSRLKPKGWTHPGGETHAESGERLRCRRDARMKLAYGALINRVLKMTRVPTPEEAERALHAVLGALVRRITPEEASHLLAELPSLLRARFAGVARGPDRSITREAIERIVESELQVGSQRASEIVRRVGLALEQSISAGEIEDVRAQLPSHLRELFPAASAA